MIKTLPSLVEKTRDENMSNKHTVQFAAYGMMDIDRLHVRRWMDKAKRGGKGGSCARFTAIKNDK